MTLACIVLILNVVEVFIPLSKLSKTGSKALVWLEAVVRKSSNMSTGKQKSQHFIGD